MELLYRSGNENIAVVYIAKTDSGKFVEFVESVQPPIPRNKKWVLIVSTLFGCPVRCKICDAGSYYKGKLSKEEIFSQIDFPVRNRYPGGIIGVKKFKIQFARMGEPVLNPAVLEVMEDFGNRYDAPGFIPSISTVAPLGCDNFLSEIIRIKNDLYPNGKFQLQFSLHSTSEEFRDYFIPVKKWSFKKIAAFGRDYFKKGDRKITLNFALSENTPFNPGVVEDIFDPEIFILKFTPVNPTRAAKKNRLVRTLDLSDGEEISLKILDLKNRGFEILESIGELEENRIGSNCGQHLLDFLDKKREHSIVSYGYKVENQN